MKILYIGDNRPAANSRLRALALERLGHEIICLSPEDLVGPQVSSHWLGRFHYRTGYRFLDRSAARAVARSRVVQKGKFDLAWVNSGEWFGPATINELKKRLPRVVLYVNDDPTSPRDGSRWGSLKRAAAAYSLIAVVREENVTELRQLGAQQVKRVWMSYDELAHRPPVLTPEDQAQWGSEVLFAGTWMPERGPFMVELLRLGVPVSIFGDHWHKAPEWPQVRSAYRGRALAPVEYVKAIASAKISLGLLSKGNRDLHTRRSMEIPYIGGLLCAERTREHQQLYREGEEAVFWSNAAECAAQCQALLADDARREKIRLAGMAKVRQLGVGNEDIGRQVLGFL